MASAMHFFIRDTLVLQRLHQKCLNKFDIYNHTNLTRYLFRHEGFTEISFDYTLSQFDNDQTDIGVLEKHFSNTLQ